MSEFPPALGWLALQVAAVAVVALLLDSRLAKRCPAAAARLLFSALLVLPLLTAAMFCPLPDWWTWQRPAPAPDPAEPVEHRSAAIDAPTAPATATGAGGLLPLEWLARLKPTAQRLEPSPRAGRILMLVWLIGVSLSALHLSGGLLSAARLRRRSRPVLDPGANEMLRSLAARLGLRRAVELRVANLPGLPATAGWRRPVVLLPADWAQWDEAELRAALSHELAHIHTNDFLTVVLAKALALAHFYHPLTRRLLARLRLRQEQAADALAGTIAGDKREYLRALARLALRREPLGAGVPPPLMMSAHGGDLFRRIQMLRNMEEVRPLSKTIRALTLAVLAGSALLASALRGPAQMPAVKPAAAKEEAEPFDLSYLAGSEGTHAVVAFRPALLLAQPGMDVYAKAMSADLTEALKAMGRSLPDGLSLADIDQVVADQEIRVHGEGGKGQRALMVGSRHLMIRMKRDVDWATVIAALVGKIKTVKQDGHTIYAVKTPILGPVEIGLCALDARTLLMVHKKGDQFVIPAKGAKRAFDLGPAWKKVERCAFAVGCDNRGGHWAKASEMKEFAAAGKVLDEAESICLGVQFGDGIEGRLYVTGKDEAQATQCAGALKALVKLARTEITAEMKDGEATGNDLVAMKLFEEIFKTGKIEQTGVQVQAEGSSRVKLAEFLPALSAKEP